MVPKLYCVADQNSHQFATTSKTLETLGHPYEIIHYPDTDFSSIPLSAVQNFNLAQDKGDGVYLAKVFLKKQAIFTALQKGMTENPSEPFLLALYPDSQYIKDQQDLFDNLPAHIGILSLTPHGSLNSISTPVNDQYAKPSISVPFNWWGCLYLRPWGAWYLYEFLQALPIEFENCLSAFLDHPCFPSMYVTAPNKPR